MRDFISASCSVKAYCPLFVKNTKKVIDKHPCPSHAKSAEWQDNLIFLSLANAKSEREKPEIIYLVPESVGQRSVPGRHSLKYIHVPISKYLESAFILNGIIRHPH